MHRHQLTFLPLQVRFRIIVKSPFDLYSLAIMHPHQLSYKQTGTGVSSLNTYLYSPFTSHQQLTL